MIHIKYVTLLIKYKQERNVENFRIIIYYIQTLQQRERKRNDNDWNYTGQFFSKQVSIPTTGTQVESANQEWACFLNNARWVIGGYGRVSNLPWNVVICVVVPLAER